MRVLRIHASVLKGAQWFKPVLFATELNLLFFTNALRKVLGTLRAKILSVRRRYLENLNTAAN